MFLSKWLRRRNLLSASEYDKRLRRYRRDHPESIEEDRKQIHQWIEYINSRRAAVKTIKEEQSRAAEVRLAAALNEMQVAARSAFMTHPAATEYDFRRCWPSIREEILKQHALDELAHDPTLLSTVRSQPSENQMPHYSEQDPKNRKLRLL